MRTSTASWVILSVCTVTSAFGQAAGLKAPDSFASITDRAERSRALFLEASKVIQHPRCMNCHPGGERPTQGSDMHPHSPMVVRGADDKGAVGMHCTTCHQSANYEPSGVPGHPLWHVAPKAMAWQGKSLGQICEQIKDPARNGGKTLAAIQQHMAHDSLVGWGLAPRRQPRECARHAGAARCADPGLDRQRGGLPGAVIRCVSPRRGGSR